MKTIATIAATLLLSLGMLVSPASADESPTSCGTPLECLNSGGSGSQLQLPPATGTGSCDAYTQPLREVIAIMASDRAAVDSQLVEARATITKQATRIERLRAKIRELRAAR